MIADVSVAQFISKSLRLTAFSIFTAVPLATHTYALRFVGSLSPAKAREFRSKNYVSWSETDPLHTTFPRFRVRRVIAKPTALEVVNDSKYHLPAWRVFTLGVTNWTFHVLPLHRKSNPLREVTFFSTSHSGHKSLWKILSPLYFEPAPFSYAANWNNINDYLTHEQRITCLRDLGIISWLLPPRTGFNLSALFPLRTELSVHDIFRVRFVIHNRSWYSLQAAENCTMMSPRQSPQHGSSGARDWTDTIRFPEEDCIL